MTVSTTPAVRGLVLRALGTNCEEETARALERVGASAEVLHLNALANDPGQLADAKLLVIPGGFSYGDDVAAGRLFGHELRRRLGEPLTRFVADGGYVLGICNGFQVLVELGLIEGLDVPLGARRVALTGNVSNHYECRWVHLRNERSQAKWLEPGVQWPCPVAHAEGRLAFAPGALEELEAAGQVALRYVSADGGEPDYPASPNGSEGHVAGLCDASGRVLGLMPHPERNFEAWHHPQWTRLGEREAGEGRSFFESWVRAAAEGGA